MENLKNIDKKKITRLTTNSILSLILLSGGSALANKMYDDVKVIQEGQTQIVEIKEKKKIKN
ncbi:MAG: hypothetical protein Q3988_03020 [Gemella sp.]|nr:hypothetical protein [Gemella sp.]